ncbi:hypothetical protein FQN54_009640 [Arachnomyces sp. PD_36]|nr:hypothetical protein FQN54_009640 [Arachnomyces sp. PD_36]
MPLHLQKVTSTTDFHTLIPCQWASFSNPPQPFFSIFFPILGTHPTARQDSILESTQRQIEWHNSDPTSYWQKIVDSETGDIAGGALWKICEKNPFEGVEGEEVVAGWYPEGVRREFMSQALKQYVTPRRNGNGPIYGIGHFADGIGYIMLVLNILFTHPNHRRKGAGDLAMEWGIKKADELGIEMWIDATPLGLPLYKKHGLIVVHETVLEPKTDNPSEEWNKVKEEFGHVVVAHLWRPAYGKMKEGQDVPRFEG